jgi:DNA polymerase III epsilon subunit-like protein
MALGQEVGLTTATGKDANYISVDVETAGPAPAHYPLLSIGACQVAHPGHSFYAELKPDRDLIDPQALRVSGLDFDRLKIEGVDPAQAMRDFARWAKEGNARCGPPVFVAYNAPFDWMFVQAYFQRYDIENPFGHSALDMKALAMGLLNIRWSETGMQQVSERLESPVTLTHNALQDAQDQALLFQRILSQLNREE